MSRRKSHIMERMADGRRDVPRITAKELYEVSPPKLTPGEVRHFDFGNVTVGVLFDRLDPILRASSKAGHTAAITAKTLNRKNLRTACGAPWDRRLAWFARKMWGDAQAQAQRFARNPDATAVDRAAKRLSDQRYRKQLNRHFTTPKVGDKFPELAELRARLSR